DPIARAVDDTDVITFAVGVCAAGTRLRHADVDRGAVHVPRLTSRARWAVHVARTRGDAAAIETEPVLALVVHGAGLARASRSHRSATQLLDAHRAPEHTHQPAATVAVGAA